MRRTIRKFLAARGGNFALLSALASLPLVMAAGFAIDVATIERARSQLQQAMDAAVLSIAREGEEVSDARARELAKMFLDENFDSPYVNLAVDRDGTRVDLAAISQTKLAFGGLFGYDTWPVEAASSADIAYAIYEIALVLDTTGSMSGGKLAAMKDAVNGLIDTMSDQVTGKDRLKFALVPFSTFVNVGPDFGPSFDKHGMQNGDGEAWLDLQGNAQFEQVDLQPGVSRFRVANHLGQKWTGCVETRAPTGSGAGRHDVLDTRPDPSAPNTLFVPAFAPDEPDVGYANSYLDNDILDLNPLDKTIPNLKRKLDKYGIPSKADGKPDKDKQWAPAKKIAGSIPNGKGPNRGCDSRPITPLTTDFAGLKSEVNAFVAKGTTNIMEGVAWGWRVLSPHEPFSEGRPATSGVEKIMIVLTDGSNVLGINKTLLGSQYASVGYLADGRLGALSALDSVTNAAMNEKTLDVCANAKASGIKLYTIRLEEPNVATGMMLKECATDETHFFDAPSRSQLDDVFRMISDRIVRIRISS